MINSPGSSPSEQRLPIGCGSRVFVGLVLFVASYCAYMLASQAFWDWRVRSMCAAEGGVTVFVPERIRVEARYLHWNGEVGIPEERKEDDLYFLRRHSETLVGGDPVVWRSTAEVVRASDNFVLGRGVMFGRAGGDIFPIDSSTQFTCPYRVDRVVINEVFAK